MAHKIQTSNACIGYIVDTTIYETYIGELWGGIPYPVRDKADDEIGKSAVEYIESVIWDILPSDYDDDFEIEYVGTHHPKYYNFDTDSVIFDFTYEDELFDYMLDYASNNRESFEKFLAKKFTSHDGYVSFTPNNWDDWHDGYVKDDFRCVSVLLYFMIVSEAAVEVDDSYNIVGENTYQECFVEMATQIISEGYTPYEYAVRYDNGMIIAVFSEYDNNGAFFNCYLVDANGNVIKHEQMSDAYEEFNGSAFAAFEYGDVENILDDDSSLYNMSHESCDVPDTLEHEF